MLQFIDGVRDIGTIARLSHLGEFETTKVLYQLTTSGFVDTKQQPVVKLSSSKPGDSLQDIFSKVVDAFNEVYAKIFSAVEQRGKAQPLLKGLESFFGSVAEFAPLFVGLAMDERGTLAREQLLANLHMAPTDDKLDYLHRGLNELLFFELFTAGEAVDRREEIELHQRLNQIIRDRGGDGGGGSGDGGSGDGGSGDGGARVMVAEPGDANEEAIQIRTSRRRRASEPDGARRSVRGQGAARGHRSRRGQQAPAPRRLAGAAAGRLRPVTTRPK